MMADATSSVRYPSVTTDFDDVFHRLRVALEEIREKPRPQQLRRSVLFVSGKVNDSDVEFLLDKQPYCRLASSPIFKFAFFRELTPFMPVRSIRWH